MSEIKTWTVEAENAALRDVLAAAEALGAMPDGYCFCSKDRRGDKDDHEPECRDLRAAIDDAREG